MTAENVTEFPLDPGSGEEVGLLGDKYFGPALYGAITGSFLSGIGAVVAAGDNNTLAIAAGGLSVSLSLLAAGLGAIELSNRNYAASTHEPRSSSMPEIIDFEVRTKNLGPNQ